MSALIRAKDRPAPPRRGKTTKRAVGSRNMRAPVKTPWLTEKNKRSIAITAGLGGLVAIVMLIASGLPGRAWAAVCDAMDRAAVDAGFAVTSVTVSGRDATTSDAILKAVHVKYGAPILSFDVDAARARIEDLSSVAAARVSRKLPNEIHIAITERVPFARWQIDGQRYVIDQNGNVITDRKVQSYHNLTEIVGVGAPKAVKELVAVYKSDPDLAKRVEAAVRIGERRWNLHFDNGVVVRFPEKDFAGAWLRLSRLEATKQILDRAVDYVDLRAKDKIFIRPLDAKQLQLTDQKPT
jgi:cell division protein FtsQ